MILKIYGLIGLLGVSAVAITFFAGYFTALAAIVFGFLSFGYAFMGVLSVLPSIAEEQAHSKH